jgi:hypothetical protein
VKPGPWLTYKLRLEKGGKERARRGREQGEGESKERESKDRKTITVSKNR